MNNAYWLVGLIDRPLDLSLLAAAPSFEPDRPTPLDQVECGPGLIALTCRVDARSIDAALNRSEGPDPLWVAPRAARHAALQEMALQHASLVPARFGLVFGSRDALRQRIWDHADSWRDALDTVADSVEWTLAGLLDSTHARAARVAHDPVWRARFHALPSSPGARYLQEKAFHRDLDQTLQRDALAHADHLVERLGDLIRKVVPLPLRAKAAGTDNPAGEIPVFRRAILLKRASQNRFLERLESLATALLADGLVLEWSGPWPAHHFLPDQLREPN